jgi:hypothetical protein
LAVVHRQRILYKPTGKVIGEPDRGKLDVRFDEGAEGKRRYGMRTVGLPGNHGRITPIP